MNLFYHLNSVLTDPNYWLFMMIPQRLFTKPKRANYFILSDKAASLSSAVFSNDGTRILSASRDGTAILWDSKTGAPTGLELVHKDYIDACAISPDGKHIASGSRDHTALVLNVETGGKNRSRSSASWWDCQHHIRTRRKICRHRFKRRQRTNLAFRSAYQTSNHAGGDWDASSSNTAPMAKCC